MHPHRAVNRRVKVGLIGIALAIVGVYVVYLVGVNALLASGRISHWVANAQDNVRIEYDRATSFIPGRLNTKNMRIVSQDSNVEVEIDIEDTTASLALLPLLEKRVEVSNGSATGVRMRVRKTRAIEELCKLPAHELPPIGALARPTGFLDAEHCRRQKETRMIANGPPDPDRLWTLVLDGVRAEEIREVWLDRWRFLGDGSSQVTMTFHPTIALSIEENVLELHRGGLMRGAKVIADDMRGSSSTVLPNVSLEEHGEDRILAAMTGTTALSAEVDNFGFLDRTLADVGRLSFGDGRGHIDLDLRAKDGRFLAGSKLAIKSERLTAKLLDHTAVGNGRVDIAVDAHKKARLVLRLDRFVAHRRSDKKSALDGRGLVVEALSSNPTLKSPLQKPDLSISVEDVRIPDVSVYNGFIPAEAELDLISGEAHAAGQLMNGGHLKISGSDIRARFKKLDIAIAIGFDAPVVRVDFKKHSYGLDGAELSIRAMKSDWNAHLAFPYLSMATSTLDARVNVDMTNARPLFEIFEVEAHVPGFVKHLVPGRARGSLELSLAPDAFALDEIDMKAGPLTAKGHVMRRGKTADGTLSMSYLGVKLALEIDNDRTHLALFSSGTP